MGIPIVVVAFGTTTKALDTYRFMDSIFRNRFKGHRIEWAYSSRLVRDFIKAGTDVSLRTPRDVISGLSREGNEWVVVQSLHLICGHEFYRMVEEVRGLSIRSSIGLPLLTEPRDYYDVAEAFRCFVLEDQQTAYVFVGHGTDHPSWTSYVALERIMNEVIGENTFVGVIEGVPSRDDLIKRVCERGFESVNLIPLMLVAGRHYYEDLAGKGNSWKEAFERAGRRVRVEERGIGYLTDVVEIFSRHIEEALDLIPSHS